MADDQTFSDEIHKDPNFAVICSFIEHYGGILGLPDLSFADLERYLSDTRGVNRVLKDIFLKLLRRWKTSVNAERWEKYLIKFCATYKMVDAWELEEFGFQRIKISTKLRILKNLLETQFDCNPKFKEKINEKNSEDLRYLPLGRDVNGLAYWFILDKDFNVRIYREEQDDVDNETWEVVVKDRNALEALIAQLRSTSCKAEDKSRSATPSTVGDDVDASLTKVESEDSKDATEPPQRKLSVVKEETEDEDPDKPVDSLQDRIKSESSSEPFTNDEVKSSIKTEMDERELKQEPVVKEESSKKKKIKEEPPDIPPDETAHSPELTERRVSQDPKSPVVISQTDKQSEDSSKNSVLGSKTKNTILENETESENKQITPDEAVATDAKESQAKSEIEKSTDSGKDCSSVVSREEDESKVTIEKVEQSSEIKTLELTPDSPKTEPPQETSASETLSKEETDSSAEKSESVNKPESKSNDLKENSEPGLISEETSKETVSADKPESSDEKQQENKPKSSPADESGQSPTAVLESVTPELKSQDSKDETERTDNQSPPDETNTRAAKKRARISDSPPLIDQPKEDDACRKRKRGRSDRHSESEAEEKSESELSESQSEGDSAKDSDAPPSKKRRDRSRKSLSQRGQIRPKIIKESESSGEDKANETKEPEDDKGREEDKIESKEEDLKQMDSTEEVDSSKEDPGKGDKQAGSDKENKKRGRGAGKIGDEAIESELEPSAKKGRSGRQPAGRGKGRGRGRGRAAASGVGRTRKNSESDEEAAPPVELRRSSRSNKGQRIIEPLSFEPIKKRKSKKDKDEEERDILKAEKTARKEERRKRKEEKQAKALAIAKKKKRVTKESDDEFVPGAKKGRKKKKNDSDSDESESETDEELFEPEEEEESLKFSSSASSESEDSDGEEYQPTGRNAKRAAARQKKAQQASSDEDQINDDTPCRRCGQYNHPELILLCDTCDAGYHTACLRPPLMIIPDGDWFCPPCEHNKLIEKLATQLTHIDSQCKEQEKVLKRRERLAFVGISLDNILPEVESDPEEKAERERKKVERQQRQRERERQRDRERRRRQFNVFEEDEEDFESSSESSEESASEVEEEDYGARRSRRQKKEINYKFEEFDDIICKAIEEDVKTADGAGMNGKGKDMSTIEGAQDPYADDDEDEPEEEEEEEDGPGGKDMSTIMKYQTQETIAQTTEPSAAVKPPSKGKDIENVYGIKSEDEENGRPLPVSRRKKKKKSRRLTALDSDEDPEEDDESEEYKASDDEPPSDVEDENVSEYDGESGDEWVSLSRRKKQKRASKGTRRSRRNRRRKYDDDFVDDEEYDSDEEREALRNIRRSARKKVSYREDTSGEEALTDSGSEKESSDASYYSNQSWEHKKSRRKSVQQKKAKKPKEAKRKRKIVYSDDDDDDEEEESVRPIVIRKRKTSNRYEDDSEFNPSDDSMKKTKGRRAASRKVNYRDMVGSDTEEDEPESKPVKKTARKNVIMSSGESGTDEYNYDDDKDAKKPAQDEEADEDTEDEDDKVEERNVTVKEGSPEKSVSASDAASPGDGDQASRPCLGKANRKHGSRPFPKKPSDSVSCSNGLDPETSPMRMNLPGNSNSNCNNQPPAPIPPPHNGGFMIENLLKDTRPTVVVDDTPVLGVGVGGDLDSGLPLDDGEDSLSDVDDLVSYVTQE